MESQNLYEVLKTLFANVNDWLKFAEAKNFGLLAFNAAVTFGISQTSFSGHSIIALSSFYILGPSLIFSSFAAILSLMPILSAIEKGKKVKKQIEKFSNFIDAEKPFANIFYFGYLRTLDVDEFIVAFNERTSNTAVLDLFSKDLIVQILYNSRITQLKYQLFKIAGFFLLIGLILSIASVPAIKITQLLLK